MNYVAMGENDRNLPPALRTYVDICWLKQGAKEQRFIHEIRNMYMLAWRSTARVGTSYVCQSLTTRLGLPYGNGTRIAGDECGWNVFCGGHVILTDGGIWYDEWRAQIEANQLKGARRDGPLSGSSHYKGLSRLQYEVHVDGLGCVLFGTVGDSAGGHTWFQAESWEGNIGGNSIDGWGRTIAHGMLGFGVHKISGNRQVGALGTSDFSEKAPRAPLVLPRELTPPIF